MFIIIFIQLSRSDPQAKWRASVRGCKWLGLRHRIHDFAAARVRRFQKKIFFASYNFCTMACTKIGDQVLVAANGSGYVIEYRIIQHLMITRIQKYFLFFLSHTVFA